MQIIDYILIDFKKRNIFDCTHYRIYMYCERTHYYTQSATGKSMTNAVLLYGLAVLASKARDKCLAREMSEDDTLKILTST